MRQGLFLTLPDVVDAFVVSGKHTSRKDELKSKNRVCMSVIWFFCYLRTDCYRNES